MKSRQKIRLITPAGPPLQLNSWKEIAAYLNRDARTVQLWEKHEGLPIHRLIHQSRSSIYAYPHELDTWMQKRIPGKLVAVEAAAGGPGPSRFDRLHAARWYLAAAAVLLVLLGAGLWSSAIWRASAKPPAGKLAVLPFENLSSSEDLLADGLTDGLITDLGKSGQIQVISRRSVMQFKGQPVALPQIAAKLHASLVLEGTIARSGKEMRVTAQLLDAASDRNLWASSYSRTTDDVLGFQDEIAAEIATDVLEKLTGAAPQRSFNSRAVDPRARLAYLTGRHFWDQRDEPGILKAISYFQQTASIDPQYAPAYAGLADSYNLMAVWGKLPADVAFSRAKQAALKALSLDPSSAEAYNSLAFATYRQDWDFVRADQYFQKAIALNPNYAVAHQWYGEFLGDMRRFDQSIAELRKARELDPLSAIVGCDLADAYIHAGRYPEAEAELKRILELYPDFAPAHIYLVGVYIERADFAAAAREAQAYARRTGDETQLQMVEIRRQSASGNTDQAHRDLSLLLSGKSGASFSSYQKAQLFFATGQTDAGYAALEDAYRERSWWLVTMMVDPGFAGVRNQPRFREVARRVGLAK
jgi:TolB-like protein/Tfp pilus assembly protein PilF